MKRDILWPVLGSDDLDAMLREQKELARDEGESFRSAEIQFACVKHLEAGMRATYEDGLIGLTCMVCGTLKGQFEIAAKGRALPLEYKH